MPGTPAAARQKIDDLLKFADLGRHLVEPWRVVIAGAPNVGKSSLVNALAGFPRSVVAPLPGTTRDVVATELALDGWPVQLHDTAGLRSAASELEQEGITLARNALARADLILWLLDATTEPVWPDATIDPGWLLVVNKTDQALCWDAARADGALFISAQTGAGLPALCAAISRRLVPLPPSPDCPVPLLASQIERLEVVRRSRCGATRAGAGIAPDQLNRLGATTGSLQVAKFPVDPSFGWPGSPATVARLGGSRRRMIWLRGGCLRMGVAS